ncbi:CBS domain-containing protein [bacterium]|nr:CBS domain-containing protein [bacterium]
MLIHDILKQKGDRIVSVNPGTTVYDAVQTMVENKVGAVLVVQDGNKPVGIFTERDNLRITVKDDCDPENETVDQHMTSENLVVGLPSDTVEEAMKVMNDRRVRHLPVVEDGKLIGLVSMGDVVRWTAEKFQSQVHYLKDYIAGSY